MKEILQKKPKKTLNIWVELLTTHHLIKSMSFISMFLFQRRQQIIEENNNFNLEKIIMLLKQEKQRL